MSIVDLSEKTYCFCKVSVYEPDRLARVIMKRDGAAHEMLQPDPPSPSGKPPVMLMRTAELMRTMSPGRTWRVGDNPRPKVYRGCESVAFLWVSQ